MSERALSLLFCVAAALLIGVGIGKASVVCPPPAVVATPYEASPRP